MLDLPQNVQNILKWLMYDKFIQNNIQIAKKGYNITFWS